MLHIGSGTHPLPLSHTQLAVLVEAWRPHLAPAKRVHLSAGLGTCPRTFVFKGEGACFGVSMEEPHPNGWLNPLQGWWSPKKVGNPKMGFHQATFEKHSGDFR